MLDTLRHLIGLACLERATEQGHDFIGVFLGPYPVNDRVEIRTDQVRYVSEHRQSRRIHVSNPEVRVDDADTDRRLPQQRFVLVGPQPESFFRLLALGHVAGGAEPFDDLSLGVLHRYCTRERPPNGSIDAKHAMFQLENASLANRVLNGREQARLLVLRNVLGQPTLEGNARIRQEPAALKVAHDTPIGAHAVDHVGACRHERAKSRFTFAYGPGRVASHALKPQVRFDTRQQLARGERFDEVVIGSRFHSLHTRLGAGACREQNHREGSSRMIASNCAEQSHTVQPRHHHVGQHQIERCLAYLLQRRDSISDDHDLMAPFEQPAHVLAHVRIVVGKKNSRHGARTTGKKPRFFHVARYRTRGAVRKRRLFSVLLLRQPPQRFLQIGFAVQTRGDRRLRGLDMIRRQMGAPPGDGYRERRPTPCFAFGLNASAMKFGEFVNQGETDPAAFQRAAASALHAMKTLE